MVVSTVVRVLSMNWIGNDPQSALVEREGWLQAHALLEELR
jgi:hypothetical protein